VGFTDNQLGTSTSRPAAFFTRRQATEIIAAAPEPFKTLFAVAWTTGLRADETLALTLDDLNFNNKTVRVNKSVDDATRDVRQPKTPRSIAALPMTTELAEASVPLTMLQNQLRHAGVKTTLRVYSHVIPQTQRDAMEQIGGFQSLRKPQSLLKFVRK
jgi:integrase